ncbi:N-acetyltransferase [Salmonella enterica subsp. enterica serovar Choleraesuis]|nr:N-acetyltransferase [Salmonella enterica subsp. enterica serovar Choleraesuis]
MSKELSSLKIQIDPLTDSRSQELVRFHLQQMRAGSPPDQAFALDISGLQSPDITVWSAWHDDKVCGIGALKKLSDGNGEIKSMRTHPDFLRSGIAAKILETIIYSAQERGYRRLSLETGCGPLFEPALELYRRYGFIAGEAFGSYQPSEFNQFFHLVLHPCPTAG